jgi:hypothetical protein
MEYVSVVTMFLSVIDLLPPVLAARKMTFTFNVG